MKRFFRKIATILLTVGCLLLPTLGQPYDSDKGVLKEFFQKEEERVDLGTSVFNVTTVGAAEGLYPQWSEHAQRVIAKRGVGIFAGQGSGMHIGRGYIVTCAHVVVPDSISIQVGSNFSYIVPIVKIISQTIFIGNDGLGHGLAEIVWVSPDYDLALLRVVGTWPALQDPGYRPTLTWVDGDKVHDGDAVCVVVQIRDALGEKTGSYEVRYGKIIAPKPVVPPGMSTDMLPWFNLSDVTMDTTIYPGDSGSPVFAWEGGEPKFIGVARAGAIAYDWVEGKPIFYSYFSRIDPIYPFSVEK